jgi:2-polyprenyl-3-methyl-5-hydroxy-6-metoxy-1,4-benzoquinol methylase
MCPRRPLTPEQLDSDLTQSWLEKQAVTSYFESRSSYWDEMYSRRDLCGYIYQQRLSIFLRWAEQLALPEGSRILDIGCGAGVGTVALARQGHFVTAMDAAQGMIEHARQRASEAGVADRITTSLGDVHRLAFPSDHFAMVLAMGVIPWLPEPEAAIREMARVVEPGGYVLASTDNLWRLHSLFNASKTHFFGPFRWAARALRRAMGRGEGITLHHLHSVRHADRLFRSVGLKKIKSITLGFGPFSFFGHRLLRDSVGIQLHQKLQDMADRGLPVIGSAGGQYLVLMRKMHRAGDSQDCPS